ncbi:TolB family protein [Mycobacterium heidelbergense]|uniref:TolB family protein n=1 Tax=Mycobacterium heidelbergense TaxID=53376 RepID=UPI003CF70B34
MTSTFRAMFALMATATAAATIAFTPAAHAEPSPTMAAHGVEAPLSAVPWSQVGPGWMLAMWSPVPGLHHGESPPAGSPTWRTAATTLFLVDPAGGRYPIITFPPPGDGHSPTLDDWSGDGTRALFSATEKGRTVVTEVDLRTGAKTTFTTENGGSPRYTRPDGRAVLVSRRKGSGPGSLERVDLAGNHQLTYPLAEDFTSYLATADGTRLVVGTASGLALMGNDGVPGKALPIAGQKDCSPTRWWDAGSTIALARCGSSGVSQLWLVPIDGGAPTALTAPNDGHQGPDYGDLNAWQLPTGTFVQAAGACGVVFLAKLNGDGTTSKVSVPEVKDDSVVVVGVNGGDLDLKARAGCGGGQALIDYNPATGTSTVLLGPSVNGGGVINAVPYPGQK